jgi:hypothetical protein
VELESVGGAGISWWSWNQLVELESVGGAGISWWNWNQLVENKLKIFAEFQLTQLRHTDKLLQWFIFFPFSDRWRNDSRDL